MKSIKSLKTNDDMEELLKVHERTGTKKTAEAPNKGKLRRLTKRETREGTGLLLRK